MNVHVVVVLLTTLPAAMAMSFLPPDYHRKQIRQVTVIDKIVLYIIHTLILIDTFHTFKLKPHVRIRTHLVVPFTIIAPFYLSLGIANQAGIGVIRLLESLRWVWEKFGTLK